MASALATACSAKSVTGGAWKRRLGRSSNAIVSNIHRTSRRWALGLLHGCAGCDPWVGGSPWSRTVHRVQREKVQRTGLSPLVDVIVVSDEVGVAKPDPGIFATAASSCGEISALVPNPGGGHAPAPSAWIIGDSAETDMAAARAMALPSIWLRRQRDWTETGWRPTVSVESVEAALDHVLSIPP